MQVICGRVPKCAFRVDDQYFMVKRRFQPRQCANCGGPVNIVEDYTDDRILGAEMNLTDDSSGRRGQIINT